MTSIILNIDMRYTDAFGEPQRHTLTDVSRILHVTGHCAAHQLAMHGDTCVVQFDSGDLERANVNMLTLISRLCRGLHRGAIRVLIGIASRVMVLGPSAPHCFVIDTGGFTLLNGETLGGLSR